MNEQTEVALTALCEAIRGVHGFCGVCARDFIEEANTALEQAGIPYRYAADQYVENVTVEAVKEQDNG